MAKKQKSFADKAAGNASGDSVYVKYVKSVQSEETGPVSYTHLTLPTKRIV